MAASSSCEPLPTASAYGASSNHVNRRGIEVTMPATDTCSYPVMDGDRTRRCRRIAVVWLAVKNEWRGYCPQHAVIFLGRPNDTRNAQ